MGRKGEGKALSEFFKSSPSLGAPFINLLRSGEAIYPDPKISQPIIICSPRFLDSVCIRGRQLFKYLASLSFLYITGLTSIKEIAHCCGRINKVLFYQIPRSLIGGVLDGCDSVLCNLSLEANKHSRLCVTITKERGPIKAYSRYISKYITCEESPYERGQEPSNPYSHSSSAGSGLPVLI